MLEEQVFLNKITRQTIRPFSEAAQVYCHARSFLLQKAFTDFSAEGSFAQATQRIKEHYGVDIATSTTRIDVEKHAHQVSKMSEKFFDANMLSASEIIIGETDGAMVPIVTQKETSTLLIDKRKNKLHEYKEARLALARPKGKITAIYSAIIGSIDEAGDQLGKVVKWAGENVNTSIHCVGDGALWIAEQVERIFGNKANFLLDFYHASQYLSGAANCCKSNNPKLWFREQQEFLKQGMIQKVLDNLQSIDQQSCQLQDKCLALKCYNYLSKRLNQLHYKEAIAKDLPIGSGEIESAHRTITQKRLKIAGAWWTIDNARAMLNLSVLRANACWQKYWTAIYPKSISAFCS